MSGLAMSIIKKLLGTCSFILKPFLKYGKMIETSRRENFKRKSFISRFNRDNKRRAYRNDEI